MAEENRGEPVKKYLNIIVSLWAMMFMMRVYETCALLITFGNVEGLLLSELAGLAMDIVVGSAVMLVLYPLYKWIAKRSEKLITTVFLALIAILMMIHVAVLQYFFNQHKLLDALLFGYSFEEMFFTVTTANVSVWGTVFTVLIAIILFLTACHFIKKTRKTRALQIFTLSMLPIAIAFCFVPTTIYNEYTWNKSFYFYKEVFKYKTTEKKFCHEITEADVADFQALYPERIFLSEEYPLLHEFDAKDSLGYYFDDFDGKPNIVILIVEGLNDDFVHDYHGFNLMPNLRNLIDESLYWDHCFTLGERSFAVVPSLLGSLPYGEIGFTLLDRLPRHLTLTSVLEANGYQTDFFYGQGSWFHKKNTFFTKNNIDLIFDNTKYSEEYEKVIVGKDKYFWGYDDWSLFDQSLKVIDTLGDNPRFDVYFTGSTHSPFRIPDEEKYDQRLMEMSEDIEKSSDRKFVEYFNDYIRTLLFFDDALAEFLEGYSQRDDYQNTIFVITGDHPMTEVPPKNTLKRYHVPFIMYSPKLKTSARFENTVSHLDFYETMMAFMEQYGVERQEVSAALGGNMFHNGNNIAFMDEPRNVNDFYSDGYFISGEYLYKVDKDFNLKKINDIDKYKELRKRLDAFNKISQYTSLENYLIPMDAYCNALKVSCLVDFDHSDEMSFKTKYLSIADMVDITDYQDVTFELSFDYEGDGKNNIVYALFDEEENQLLYRIFGIKSNDYYCLYQHIPVMRGEGRTYFKAFFYNPEEHDYRVFDMNGALLGNQ